MLEIFSSVAVLGALFLLVEKIGKIPLLAISIASCLIGIASFQFYGQNNFSTGVLVFAIIAYILGGGKIPKL